MIRRLWSDLRNGPLGQRRFRLLFLGRTTSFIGNAFANVALAFAVLELTGSEADPGRITPTGTIMEFDLPDPESGPYGITLGADGNLWFTERFANLIGKITPDGTIM